MQALAIVVADASRARLFTFKREDDLAPAPVLRERVDLVSLERRQRPSELFSETRPPTGMTANGRGFGVDDHRDAHMDEIDRRFAEQVMSRLASLTEEAACHRVALVASPRFLGHLREYAGTLRQRGLPLEEVARDLTRETGPKLREHLGELGVLPAGKH